MKKRVSVIPVMLLGFAPYMVGCGGGGGKATTVAEEVFRARGNLICAEAITKQGDAYQRAVSEAIEKENTSGKGNSKGVEELVDVVSGSVATMVDEFEALGVPAGKATVVANMLEAYERGAEEVQEAPQAFASGRAFADADGHAKQLGLVRCEGM